MPIFEFKCNVCGKVTEKIYSSADNAPTHLASSDQPGHPGGFCTQGRILSTSSFVLKGAGFHKNDYGIPSRNPKRADDSE